MYVRYFKYNDMVQGDETTTNGVIDDRCYVKF